MNIGFQKNSKPKNKEKKKGGFFLGKKKKPAVNKEEVVADSALHSEVWQPSVNFENAKIDEFLTDDSTETEDGFFNLEGVDNSMGEQIALDLQMPGTEARDFSEIDDLGSDFLLDEEVTDSNDAEHTIDESLFDDVLLDNSGTGVSEPVTEEPTQELENTNDLTINDSNETGFENDVSDYDEFAIDFSVIEDTDNFDVETSEDFDLEPEESIVQDTYSDYGVLTDSDLEPIKESDNPAFVHVEANADDVINDVEYEALLDLFSTMTREEVAALPPNYRKLFDQNFKPNETYVGDSENDSIRKKLGLKDLDLREIDNNAVHLTQDEITATLNGVELPVSVIQKLLPEGKTLEEPENMKGIKAKIMSSFEPTFNSNPLADIDDSSEAPLIAINYCNDDVLDVVQLGEGSLGILPYKVFRCGKLLKADANYEITLAKDDVVIVRTGIKYIATPNCTVTLDGPDASTGLTMLGFNVSSDSIDLQLKAEKNTYINKNSVLCKINYKEI